MAFKIDRRDYNFTRSFTHEELSSSISCASSIVKLVCGVANGVAYLIMLDARDKMRLHPKWRGAIKRAYSHAFAEYDSYLRMLKFPPSDMPYFFKMEDMDSSTRKKYGNITDAQYFEFWESLAGAAYTHQRKYITSLANKYRLSLVGHGNPYAEILQWPMVAQAMLELSVTIWEVNIEDLAEKYHLPKKLLQRFFSGFSLSRVAAAWKKALEITDNAVLTYDLDANETRNIELGIEQLQDAFSDPKTLYESLLGSVEAYDEIFRTKGEHKKVVREIENLIKT